MKFKQLLTKTLLVAAGLCVGANSAWADETILSVTPTTAYSVPKNTSDAPLASYITITGGTMYVSNGQSSEKNLITDAGSKKAFQMTNGNTFFKIVLTKALQEGDEINAQIYSNTGGSRGLWLSTATSYPSSAPTPVLTVAQAATSNAWTAASKYTVSADDGICGETTFYIYRATGNSTYFRDFTITRTAVAPGAISFSPAAGSVAVGTSVTLTSSGATTIQYQWGAAAIDGDGDWSGAVTYSNSNKPVVPAAGSANTVLSVKATNANGSTYGSAAYTPVKMALKTIYSFADGIGSQEVTDGDATITGTTEMKLSDTAGRIMLTPATGYQFNDGDAITFSGSVGNSARAYGIKYGPTTSLGTELNVAAGAPCYVSGTLTLGPAADNLYIGRSGGTTTNFVSFAVRRLVAATSEAYSGVKIDGSTATEGEDYTKEGNVITLSGTYSLMPNVALVNHIVFADESTEDQSVTVAFNSPDGEYFTGTATIDGTTYTVKAACGQINALKVVYKDGGTTIKEENLDVTGRKVGASYTVPFRMYVEKDGALYQTTKNGSSPYYGDAVTLEYNTTVTKSVNSVDLNGGTIELMEDFDGSSSENAPVRASNCSAYNNTAYTSTNDLPSGVYTFIVKALNKGRGSSVKVGEQTIFTISDVYANNNNWTDKTFENVVVPVAGKLSLADGGVTGYPYDCYDILIAIRQPAPATVSATIGATGWTTFSSVYPLDLSGMTASAGDVTAFYASSVDGSSVTMTSTASSAVAACEGIMLKGTADATITIPVVANGTAISGNKLKGCTTSTVLGTNANYYVLVNNGGTAEFQNLSEHGATIPAGKAYLNASGSGAKSLKIVFDDETLGINDASMLNSNAEGMNDKQIYNLSGQRIAAPQKGINIIGGRKVVVK